MNKDKSVKELIIKGRKLSKVGKYEEAIIQFDKVLEIKPEMAIAIMFLKGNALSKAGKFNEAIDLLDKILELSPEKVDNVLHLKGSILLKKVIRNKKLKNNPKEYEEVKAYFDK
jgi:tetratricopeptide (TPR) repeat protein